MSFLLERKVANEKEKKNIFNKDKQLRRKTTDSHENRDR